MVKEYSRVNRQECVEIFMDNFINPPFEYSWMKYENIHRYFEDLENTPNFLGFVFYDEDRLIGMCFGTVSDYFMPTVYDIKEILVRREMQSQGHGTAALARIGEILRSRNVEAITLNTNSYTDAYFFYLKNGYEVAPKAVMMIKLL